MPTWAAPTRPSPDGSAQAAYPADEVDAWAAAVGVTASRLGAELLDATARTGRAEGQIGLLAAGRQAVDLAAAEAAARLGPSVPQECRQVLDEAHIGALAVLASACRKIAELYGTTAPRLPTRAGPVANTQAPLVANDQSRRSFTSSPPLELKRAYVLADGDRYLDSVHSTVESQQARLETAVARAEEAEGRLFDLAAGISSRSTTDDVEVATTAVPTPTDVDLHALLAATRWEAFEILAVARRAISGLYGHAENDLLDPTPGP